MSLLPRPYPGSSTTASIGVNMAFDDPATPPGHTASPRAKGGGLVPLSLLIATVRRENEEFWELWRKLNIVSVKLSFLVTDFGV